MIINPDVCVFVVRAFTPHRHVLAKRNRVLPQQLLGFLQSLRQLRDALPRDDPDVKVRYRDVTENVIVEIVTEGRGQRDCGSTRNGYT